MAGHEGSGVTTGQPNLSKQDLSKLDISKLTALSPEVISRQATINIGTIGHVAHGKSTVVKAISGVQTVRFKNELERNITIKLGKGAKVAAVNGKMELDDFHVAVREQVMAFEKPKRKVRKCTLVAKVMRKQAPLAETTNKAKVKKIRRNSYAESTATSADMDCSFVKEGSSASNSSVINDSLTSINSNVNGSVASNSSTSASSITAAPEEEEEGDYDDNYEVERIVDHAVRSDNKRYYLIKWRGWEEKYNNWECEDNLDSCPLPLERYWKRVYCEFGPDPENLPSREKVDALRRSLVRPTREALDALMKQGCHKFARHKEPALMKQLCDIAKQPAHLRNETNVARLVRHFMVLALHVAREEQVAKLKQWESDVNAMSAEHTKLVVENEVDLEGPPANFTYINDYVPGDGVTIPNDPPIGCDCAPSCRESGACCSSQSGAKFAYTAQKTVNVKIGTPIYECNKRCTCTAECTNRVVQNGRKVELSVFRTKSGCGWGVKTRQRILKGSFVCEYVGEVITNEEAERRGKIYDAEGRTYLFDLDYNENEQFPYTVDAAHHGNVSHFINHSCDPNLAVYAVWVNCLDPNLPKLALFATRQIKSGEEITFDYMCQSLRGEPVSKPTMSPLPASPSKVGLSEGSGNSVPKVICKCETEKCRRYLF